MASLDVILNLGAQVSLRGVGVFNAVDNYIREEMVKEGKGYRQKGGPKNEPVQFGKEDGGNQPRTWEVCTVKKGWLGSTDGQPALLMKYLPYPAEQTVVTIYEGLAPDMVKGLVQILEKYKRNLMT